MSDSIRNCPACGATTWPNSIHTCSPQVARPRVEGEALTEAVAWIKSMVLVVGDGTYRPAAMSHVTPSEYRDHAERLVDRLTAEVERLRGERAEAIQIGREAIGVAGCDCASCMLLRARLAALALPTPTPEGTDGR